MKFLCVRRSFGLHSSTGGIFGVGVNFAFPSMIEYTQPPNDCSSCMTQMHIHLERMCEDFNRLNTAVLLLYFPDRERTSLTLRLGIRT